MGKTNAEDASNVIHSNLQNINMNYKCCCVSVFIGLLLYLHFETCHLLLCW